MCIKCMFKNINLKLFQLIASNCDCCRHAFASSSWFDVFGEGNAISIFGQDPNEVAKIYGMFLLHSSKLKT
jgi:hypothetical protein